MKTPFHSSLALRGFCVFSFVAVSLLAGCGKLRSWYPHKEAENPHAATIGWTASVSPVAGYNVYRESQPSGPVNKLTTRIVSGTQYTDKTVEAGHTYSYYVTSVDFKGIESGPSAKITVTIPWTVTPPAPK
jgi:fibronectin type 3 domain-containing protein